jgi:hypothetical protein
VLSFSQGGTSSASNVGCGSGITTTPRTYAAAARRGPADRRATVEEGAQAFGRRRKSEAPRSPQASPRQRPRDHRGWLVTLRVCRRWYHRFGCCVLCRSAGDFTPVALAFGRCSCFRLDRLAVLTNRVWVACPGRNA